MAVCVSVWEKIVPFCPTWIRRWIEVGASRAGVGESPQQLQDRLGTDTRRTVLFLPHSILPQIPGSTRQTRIYIANRAQSFVSPFLHEPRATFFGGGPLCLGGMEEDDTKTGYSVLLVPRLVYMERRRRRRRRRKVLVPLLLERTP